MGTTKKDNMMKTFTLMMILSLGVLHCQTAERRPPPPPGFNDKGSSGSFGPPGLPSSFGGPSVQALKPNGGSGGGNSFGSSFGFRWVYCNRSWKKVYQHNCPAVFNDPDFSDHQCFCSGGNLQNYYEGTSIWHFDFFSFPFQYHYCSYIPPCFCEACSN